jgi:hypothetical protein
MKFKSEGHEYTPLASEEGTEEGQSLDIRCRHDSRWHSLLLHGALYLAFGGSLLLNLVQFIRLLPSDGTPILGDKAMTAYGM